VITPTSFLRGRKNSCWHGELVGPRLCGALVSEEDAGWRAPQLVRTALRFGRGKFDVLLRARTATGRALVRGDAERFHVRCKVAPTVFVSLDTGKAVAAGFATSRRNGHKRKREIDTGLAGGNAQKFSAADVDHPQRGKARRITAAAFSRIFAAET